MRTVVPGTLKGPAQTTFIAMAPATHTPLHRCQHIYIRLLRNVCKPHCMLCTRLAFVWDTLSPPDVLHYKRELHPEATAD